MAYDGTNYHYLITSGEYKKLKETHEKYKDLIPKQKESEASIIRLIILKTYKYLYRKYDSVFLDSIDVINRKFNWNSLGFNFENDIKRDQTKSKIINLAIIHFLKNYDTPQKGNESEVVHKQFRLNSSDDELFEIIEKNREYDIDFINCTIRCFFFFILQR